MARYTCTQIFRWKQESFESDEEVGRGNIKDIPCVFCGCDLLFPCMHTQSEEAESRVESEFEQESEYDDEEEEEGSAFDEGSQFDDGGKSEAVCAIRK